MRMMFEQGSKMYNNTKFKYMPVDDFEIGDKIMCTGFKRFELFNDMKEATITNIDEEFKVNKYKLTTFSKRNVILDGKTKIAIGSSKNNDTILDYRLESIDDIYESTDMFDRYEEESYGILSSRMATFKEDILSSYTKSELEDITREVMMINFINIDNGIDDPSLFHYFPDDFITQPTLMRIFIIKTMVLMSHEIVTNDVEFSPFASGDNTYKFVTIEGLGNCDKLLSQIYDIIHSLGITTVFSEKYRNGLNKIVLSIDPKYINAIDHIINIEKVNDPYLKMVSFDIDMDSDCNTIVGPNFTLFGGD